MNEYASIHSKGVSKSIVELIAKIIFLICAIIAIFAVCSITVYMFMKGTPALKSVGVTDLFFKTEWKPTASEPSYGILYIILSSIIGTAAAVAIGVPIGLLTAVFLTEVSNKKLAAIVQPAVELLAAIPSVIYGLLGLMLLNPALYKLEKILFKGSTTHQFTGGADLLAAVIVLAIMIFPTVINISASSIRAVLGIGRALGEAMAINMVAGGAVNFPLPFNSVRFLTTQIVSEMGYAGGVHRQVLFTVGLVLYIFIMIVNLILLKMKKKGEKDLA